MNKLQQLEQGLEALIESLGASDRDRLVLANKLQKQAYKNIQNPDKEYLPKGVTHSGYGHILDSAAIGELITADQALDFVAEQYGYDQGWIDSVKHHKLIYIKDVVNSYDSHTVVKAMKKDKSYDGSALKKSDTGYQLLNRESQQVGNHLAKKRLTEVEQELLVTKGTVEVLTQNSEKEYKTSSILTNMTLSQQDKIIQLKELGYTQARVSEMLRVSLSTIKRNWNNL